MIASRSFVAFGSRCQVLAEAATVDDAAALVRQQLDELDRACSPSRPDTELSRLVRGSLQPAGPVLTEVLAAALRIATRTDGLVDPTCSDAPTRSDAPTEGPPSAGFFRVVVDQRGRQVLVPRGVQLDVSTAARAWAVDRAVWTCAARFGGPVLVNLGGDIAVGGPLLPGGWQVALAEADPGTATADEETPVVTIRRGAVATSSTATSSTAPASRAQDGWRAVTVVASSCELAAAASAAALVLAEDAPQWLARRGLPARLVGASGYRVYVGDWPADAPTALRRSA